MDASVGRLDRKESVPAIGFLGAGAMGLPMVARLHEAGRRVRPVDPSPERVAACRSLGVPASPDPQTLVGCATVVAMVSTGQQLLDVLRGKPFSDHRMAATTLVVMSTVGPQAIRQVERLAAGVGTIVLDCPVTGGVSGAEAGTLTILAAGPSRALADVDGVLSELGTVHRVGDAVGRGQAFKLVNQMLTGIHIVAAAEAMSFAQALDLDLDTLLDILPEGSAASRMLVDRGPRIVQALTVAEQPVRTRLDTFRKDIELVTRAAAAAGHDARLTAAAAEQWQRAVAMGLGSGDDTGVVATYVDGVPDAGRRGTAANGTSSPRHDARDVPVRVACCDQRTSHENR